MTIEGELAALRALVEAQARELDAARHAIGLLEDKNEIVKLDPKSMKV